jgi:hypothetical protein
MEKSSQRLYDRFRGTTPAAPASRLYDRFRGTTPANTSGAGGVHRSDAIKAMQTELMTIAKTLDEFSAFKSYIQTNYMQNRPLSSMSLVGTGGVADGAWGERTDRGLREAYVLANSLTMLAESMKEHLTGITEFDLHTLDADTPKHYKDVTNADATATKLTEDLKELNEYARAVASVMTKKYGDKLSQDTTVAKYQQKTEMSNDDQSWLASHANTPLTYPSGKSILMGATPLTLGNISSPQAFQAFLQSTGHPAAKASDVKTQADYLLNMLQQEGR